MRIFILSLLAIGCGSSTSDHAKSCKDVATARCQKLMSCSASVLTRRYPSLDVCVTREAQACESSFAAPQNSNSDSRLEACAAALPSQACGDFLAGVSAGDCLPNAGPRMNGQPCAFAGQCQSTYCAIADGANCGVCADLPKVGDSC